MSDDPADGPHVASSDRPPEEASAPAAFTITTTVPATGEVVNRIGIGAGEWSKTVSDRVTSAGLLSCSLPAPAMH